VRRRTLTEAAADKRHTRCISHARGHDGTSRVSPATGLGDLSQRPGEVVGIEGVVFQCDADDLVSGLLIRPVQGLSRRLRGAPVQRSSPGVPLANHAGIRVRVRGADGRVRRYVVEQLNGTLVQNVANGLCWTPWRDFRLREGGGWDVTIPATAFQGVDGQDVWHAIKMLNTEGGQPFYREVCTAFIERVFGGRRMFGHIEILDRLVPGPGPRIPEPAAPLLKAESKLSRRAKHLLQVDDLRALEAQLAYADAAARAGLDDEATDAAARAKHQLHRHRRGAMVVCYWLLTQLGAHWSARRGLRLTRFA
jgi:hypothetical protein